MPIPLGPIAVWLGQQIGGTIASKLAGQAFDKIQEKELPKKCKEYLIEKKDKIKKKIKK